MIRAAGDICATVTLLLHLFVMERSQLIWSKVLLSVLGRDNYQSLKLAELAMKSLERIVDGFIRKMVSLDDSQFSFVPERGTTNAIFVDLETTFGHVPQNVTWLGLRKLGWIEEWIVWLFIPG